MCMIEEEAGKDQKDIPGSGLTTTAVVKFLPADEWWQEARRKAGGGLTVGKFSMI